MINSLTNTNSNFKCFCLDKTNKVENNEMLWFRKNARSPNNVDNRKERIKRNNVCSKNRMEQQPESR